MNPAVQEFIDFLDREDDEDYGDFKREVDLHFHYMVDSLKPLSEEQVWRLRKMREQLLWSYKDNIEEVRDLLMNEAAHLEDLNT
ncbi:hypothetical protein [Bdellovibrio reynosensis]|uniref:Uncharacterized protein n=1 Tax=Bdellovibrio reynosensis TaxID=2835041 RepID=A0ABY4CC84_9BACT|nr:hypothetical protein [Bdellovibrio reynosensis]UOF02586.1 hypothetical protein MNR06_06430 [Bdellovibrio reynosensis]